MSKTSKLDQDNCRRLEKLCAIGGGVKAYSLVIGKFAGQGLSASEREKRQIDLAAEILGVDI